MLITSFVSDKNECAHHDSRELKARVGIWALEGSYHLQR